MISSSSPKLIHLPLTSAHSDAFTAVNIEQLTGLLRDESSFVEST
jgi:hypothetical protein